MGGLNIQREKKNKMVEIQVNPEISFTPDNVKINQLALTAFNFLALDPNAVSFGIHFSTDDEIQSLNHQYRGIDKPTDVLSFNADVYDPEEETTYLGDIILSVPTMQRQAALAGHPENTEILLLITHGLLHLNGYDHATTTNKEDMWKLQAEILAAINIFPKKLPED